MRLLILLIAWLTTTALAAIVKTGSTCVVTPFEKTPARSIGTISPAERDMNPDNADPWAILDEQDDKQRPGAPGALGHYPRPMPSPGSRPPGSTTGRERKHPAVREQELIERQDTNDDTPQILDAFQQCGQDGTFIFKEGTYNIRQVMNTTDLRNCSIEMHGTFVWSVDNIQYWLWHGYSVTYAGRSTAWLLGGRDISMRGFGRALFNGNGQVWIDQNQNHENQDGRPIALTIWRAANVLLDGITWRQSQFWHTFVAHSTNVTMTNLHMNTTSNSQWKAVNTDGAGTWNSKDIHMANWTVQCGDVSGLPHSPSVRYLCNENLNMSQDCISVKGNSANIYVNNITCYSPGTISVGSSGMDSDADQSDNVDNVMIENVQLYGSSKAPWIKTYPGIGHVRNVTFRNIQVGRSTNP